ncbi:MAG: ATP-binding protein [Burkholderiaceae bacterium]|jgi:signal transduction histidine kinase
MKQRHSIRVRLSLAFMLLGMLVVILGLFSVWWLSDVNAASVEIRDRWLQSSRLLGDLNNYTSDYRAGEASHLLATQPTDIDASDIELFTLLRSINLAWQSYEELPHDAEEERLWKRFASQWQGYLAVAKRVIDLSGRGHKTEGTALYQHESRIAYDAASDTLGQLTDLTTDRAGAASNRAATTFRLAEILIFGAIAVAVVSVLSVMIHITRSVSEPILELTDRMHKLAANHTNIEISDTDRSDEIGEMARAVVVFRNNAIELAHSQRGLEQQASMLAEKLEHERQLTNLQRNFVSMASHEFRTPLTIIDGQAQRMIKIGDRLRPEELSDRAGKIRAAVRRMTDLLESLINSSRLLDAGEGLYFHPSEFSLASLLREVCQMHREMSADAWIVEHIGNLPTISVGDTKLLYQAFSNLVSNAIKYSPNGRPVQVFAAEDEERVVITVSDEGLGIPMSDLPHVFQRYYRGSNVQGFGGTGIGLYLVQTVATLHGGNVSVESREGRGSRFIFSLPLKAELVAATAL